MVDLIPRSVLFGNPERTSPQISPDGGALAWIAPRDGVLNLWVAPVGEESGVDWAAARPVTEDTDRGIRAFAWARDGQHVLYVQDVGGDENWRLYDVDPESLERRDLTPFEGIHATIIGTSKRRPDEVLVGINADNPQLHDVYRLHLVLGRAGQGDREPGIRGMARRRGPRGAVRDRAAARRVVQRACARLRRGRIPVPAGRFRPRTRRRPTWCRSAATGGRC